MRFSNALVGILSVILLSSCGQKGSLYLRENPPAGIKTPKPAPPKPVPYPEDTASETPGLEKRD